MAERVVVVLEAIQVVDDEDELVVALGCDALEIGEQLPAVADLAELVAVRIVDGSAIRLAVGHGPVDARATLARHEVQQRCERQHEQHPGTPGERCDQADRREERVDRPDPGERRHERPRRMPEREALADQRARAVECELRRERCEHDRRPAGRPAIRGRQRKHQDRPDRVPGTGDEHEAAGRIDPAPEVLGQRADQVAGGDAQRDERERQREEHRHERELDRHGRAGTDLELDA